MILSDFTHLIKENTLGKVFAKMRIPLLNTMRTSIVSLIIVLSSIELMAQSTDTDSSFIKVRSLLTLIYNQEKNNQYQADTIVTGKVDNLSQMIVDYDFDVNKLYRIYAVLPGSSTSLSIDVYDSLKKIKGSQNSSLVQQLNKDATYVGISMLVDNNCRLKISLTNEEAEVKTLRLLIYSKDR